MKECTYSMRKSCKIWGACSEAYAGGEDLPPCAKESQTTDTQQLKSAIIEYSNELSDSVISLEYVAIADVILKLRQLADL